MRYIVNLFYSWYLKRTRRKEVKEILHHGFSPEKMENLIERRLGFILAQLSVFAVVKTHRKSLPANHHLTMHFQGALMSKTMSSWTQSFLRTAVREILNLDLYKLRYYVDVHVSQRITESWHESGDVTVTLHYHYPPQKSEK